MLAVQEFVQELKPNAGRNCAATSNSTEQWANGGRLGQCEPCWG